MVKERGVLMQAMSWGCTNGGEENFGSYLNVMSVFDVAAVNYRANDTSYGDIICGKY